jgi:hypothetical protein
MLRMYALRPETVLKCRSTGGSLACSLLKQLRCSETYCPCCRWSKQLTWRCFLAAAVCIVVVRFSVEKCVEHGHCSYLSWASLIGFNLTFPTPYEQVRQADPMSMS